ncbi:MAG: hypothetical protein A2X36_04255 [Elusimicrobia bacterium GWA2_69_24]|nr:MAG: hypothetical protein A2X36_04255 [Elusimicrobia bacterium GWA2_69_24]
MKRRDLAFLAVLPYAPEPEGPSGDRAVYRLLAGLAAQAQVSCVTHSPPVSSQILKASLERKGVELLGEVRPDDAAFFGRIQQAVRGRHFDAAILVGPQVAGRWARPLRLLIPRQLLFCHFPNAAAVLQPIERFSASARQGVKAGWRNLLSLADGVWLSSEAERAAVQRGLSLGEGRLEVLPAASGAALGDWVRGRVRRGSAVRRSPAARVRIVGAGLSAADGAELSASVQSVTGVRSSLALLSENGEGGVVRRLNAALSRPGWDYAWVFLHPVASPGNLLRTLLEGMQVLSYAGAAVPLDAAAVKRGLEGSLPMKESLFAAAWAMRNKGSWHEVDYVSHSCCFLLRRSAWEAAGLLDERFHGAEPAWKDYFLRLQQSGRPVLLAQDALALCRGGGADSVLSGERRPAGSCEDGGPMAAADRDLLVEKWCKGSLKLMESLLTSLEPEGYRSDPRTVAARQ